MGTQIYPRFNLLKASCNRCNYRITRKILGTKKPPCWAGFFGTEIEHLHHKKSYPIAQQEFLHSTGEVCILIFWHVNYGGRKGKRNSEDSRHKKTSFGELVLLIGPETAAPVGTLQSQPSADLWPPQHTKMIFDGWGVSTVRIKSSKPFEDEFIEEGKWGEQKVGTKKASMCWLDLRENYPLNVRLRG